MDIQFQYQNIIKIIVQIVHIIYYFKLKKKILIFMRKSYIFAFNFHPVESFADYGFEAPEGEYRLVLDSDEKSYDGFSRVKIGERHLTSQKTLKLYLPSRCALVLKKV